MMKVTCIFDAYTTCFGAGVVKYVIEVTPPSKLQYVDNQTLNPTHRYITNLSILTASTLTLKNSYMYNTILVNRVLFR